MHSFETVIRCYVYSLYIAFLVIQQFTWDYIQADSRLPDFTLTV